eukprot:212441_1
MPLPSRVVDYFVVLRVAQTKVESAGRFKQIGLPLVNALRYPLRDFKDAEFPSDLGCFAFPDGARFEGSQSQAQEYSFVLTEGDGGRIYCQALRFWKQITVDDLKIYESIYAQEVMELQPQTLFEPLTIVLVSHWAFFSEFQLVLNRLFEVTHCGDTLHYTIEECLTNLIYETPLPPRGRRSVEFNCYNKKIYFKRAAPNEHSLRDMNISILFHSLSLNNILSIIIAMLCEKRILFYSVRIELLTPCIQSLCSLIFPFYWQHIYVPVLPAKFTDFVYAPMPFICGVLSSYLPDLSLLEGVVFVDLDCNVVKFHSSDPIAKFSPISNHKEINKLVSNPKKPLNATVQMDHKEVANAFIKFFAKLLKLYKTCMNPSTGPSKDKFNKEKWIKDVLNERESDKDKDETFLNLFVEAQLFECFIDERFAIDADGYDEMYYFDVLYFDEKIDQIIHNKSAPFLLDTTFLHKKKDNYIVPLPTQNTTQYTQFPLALNDTLCSIRALAPLLVSEQDLNEQQSMHISWMSVEFFKQKRLYDRQFYSLESRVNSQNVLFRQILRFFMKWQDSNHKYVADLGLIAQSIASPTTNTKTTVSYETSLDEPWSQFKKYIANYCAVYRQTFEESRKKSFIPIMESVGSKENELAVIIQTARNCESMTAKAKCEVEFANKNVLKHTKRLKDKESQLKSYTAVHNEAHANDESVSDHNTASTRKQFKLDEFINAVESKDKYAIEHVESTTTFLTNLEIFTTSMPTMIDEVQTISQQRLANFQQYLQHFIATNRAMHERFAQELHQIEDLIPLKKDKIQPEAPTPPKRRYSISRELSQIGMTRLKHSHVSIANIHREYAEDEAEEKGTKKKKKKEIPKLSIINDEKRSSKIITDDHGVDRVAGSILYSDNLWGDKKFHTVLRQCEDGKNVIKSMIKAMEDLSEVWDLQSKSLMRCTQSMKKNLKLTGKEAKTWHELYVLTEKSSHLYKSAVCEVKLSIFELKIMKGELKSINKLLQRKKGELGSEVQFATRNVQLAYDERNACLRIYRQTQAQWKQLAMETYSEQELKPLLDQMASAQLNFRQSDMKWNRSKNILRSVKQKEDLCNGVILDTFREKEINRQSRIILSITHLCAVLFELIYGMHDQLNTFMIAVLSLNVEQQINSFIDREITSSAAMLDRENIRWTAKSVQLSWISSKNGIDSAKAMLDFFLCRLSASEQYSRHFNRVSVHTHHDSNNDSNENHVMQCKFGYSLNDLFLNFNKFIYDLSAITLDCLVAIKYWIEPALDQVKKSMEHQNVSSHQLISECNTDFNKLEEKLAKSVIECRRLETQIDGLKQRISEKENKNKKSDTKTKIKSKKRTFKIFEKSREQLQTELSSTQNKLKQEISNRDRLKAQLQQKSKYRDVLFSKVITDFIRHEEYRLKMNKYIYCIYSKITEESLLKMLSLTVELKKNVETINIKNNIHTFVLQNRSSQNVPKIVLDHAIFKISQEKNAIFDRITENVNHILAAYRQPYDTLNNKLIFNHSLDEHKQLLNLKKKHILLDDRDRESDDNIPTLDEPHIYIGRDAQQSITLPKMKQVSSNQQISKHLLEYVTKHSMKGGKHARIDSLHSISRSHKKKAYNKQVPQSLKVDSIDEDEETTGL